MDALGEDLTLLAISAHDGHIDGGRLKLGLMGSELVRMAANRQIDIVADRIVVLNPAPIGDRELDQALASVVAARRPPKTKAWVSSPRPKIHEAYLARLAASGTVQSERRKWVGLISYSRWRIVDVRRFAEVKGRLDAIARSTGPVDTAQSAFGGLAFAVGLGPLLYVGRENKGQRRRLEEIAKGKWSSGAAAGAVSATIGAVTTASVRASTEAATRAASDAAVAAAVQAASDAAVQASVQAATDAAVQASVQAATDAAVHAAVQAAGEAAAHAGHDAGVGGGHGH